MTKTNLSVDLDPDVAESAAEAAESSGVSVSEWLNTAAEKAIAAELSLSGIDDLEIELAQDEADGGSSDAAADYGDDYLASP